MYTGSVPQPLPQIGGHECSGVVEDVGPGVTKVKKGDHFVGTFINPCGTCPQCLRGHRNECTSMFGPFLEGTLLDGTTRFKDKNGESLRHMLFLAGFANYSVVPEGSVIPIKKEFPLEYACLFGCCIPTGWGTVTNVANVKFGDSVAVYGLGGIGLNVLRAAVLRQANPVIAVDLEESKEALAYEFGATHFICNAKEDPVPKIQEITGGGVQFAFEAIGDSGAIVQAWYSTGVNGKLVVPGVSGVTQTTPLPLFVMPLHNKSILGSGFGNVSGPLDIPALIDLSERQDLKLDKLVTRKLKIEQINDVAEAMLKRQIKGRWIFAWD